MASGGLLGFAAASQGMKAKGVTKEGWHTFGATTEDSILAEVTTDSAERLPIKVKLSDGRTASWSYVFEGDVTSSPPETSESAATVEQYAPLTASEEFSLLGGLAIPQAIGSYRRSDAFAFTSSTVGSTPTYYVVWSDDQGRSIQLRSAPDPASLSTLEDDAAGWVVGDRLLTVVADDPSVLPLAIGALRGSR